MFLVKFIRVFQITKRIFEFLFLRSKEKKSKTQLMVVCFLGICLFFFHSCYSHLIEDELSEDTEISFSEDIVPIFENSCITCHGSDYSSPILTSEKAYESLTSGGYIDTEDPESSVLVKQLNSDHPYEGAITNKELQMIVLWIKQGANDN